VEDAEMIEAIDIAIALFWLLLVVWGVIFALVTREPGRYEVLSFPSYLGTPTYHSWLTTARVAAFLRALDGSEGRVVDRLTGEHWVV